MKNLQTKRFEIKVALILEEQKKRLIADVTKHLESIATIDFITFNNDNTYEGYNRNIIFFTYNDHYRGNSGTRMSVGHLCHPHQNMDDRGYIKGVATDLDGYMKLQSANCINHNLDAVANIYFPKLRASKHKEQYIATCNRAVNDAILVLNEFVLAQKKVLNEKLKEITGCSLLHYLMDI
jgi:hypothetical protein